MEQHIGYGINYQLKKGFLEFYGTCRNDIEDRTIVVQIKNKRGAILREIWLSGVGSTDETRALNLESTGEL